MKLKDFRKSNGMTLISLASELECSPSAISKYERNIETIPDHLIDIIQNKFGVTIEKEYSKLGVYKQRIKDLENEVQKLINYGIFQQEEIMRLEAALNLAYSNLSAVGNQIKEALDKNQNKEEN